MNADTFVEIVRKGSDKLRVDELVLNTGEKEVYGKGMLHITSSRIEVEMTFNPGENPPELNSGIFTKRDSWELSGIVEDQLRFKCEYVGPVGRSQSFWPSGIYRCTFKLHPIDLIPSGWDAMSRQERIDFLKQNQPSDEQHIAELEKEIAENKEDVSFYATLLDYPLLSRHWNGEFKGETEHFEFTLTKRAESSDLHVSLSSKKEYRSTGKDGDWKRFYAFMKALAFINGINAWPYHIEYWKAGQKITDRVTATEQLARTSHAPFTERLAFNAKTGSLKWDIQDVMSKATVFFESDTALSKEASEILFLFRQADDRVHSEITTIALCSLFENLVRLIFRELNLKEQALNDSLRLFEEAKREITDRMSEKIGEKGEGYRRLHNIIRSAQLFSMEQMFQEVVKHFGLKWQGDMEETFKTWKSARNPLVHTKHRASQSEDELKNSILDESRIAGAINILLLKLMGYSGWARTSAFEDQYRQI